MDIHYKYSNEVPFCELSKGFYPTTGKGSLKKLPENAEFPPEFCNLCKTKLKDLNLIEKETTE